MNSTKQQVLEFDLKEILLGLWSGRKLIFISCGTCVIFGLVIAFTTPPQYESYCTLVAEGGDNSGGSFRRVGGLIGSLTGINLDLNGSGSITPEFYPNIAASTPFLQEILKAPVFFSSADSVLSTEKYFELHTSFSLLGTIKAYTIGLPGKIKELIKGSETQISAPTNRSENVLRLTREEQNMVENLRGRLNVNADLKTGIVTIRCKMPDPAAAANITYESLELLKKYIMRQQQLKANAELDFIKKSHADSEIAFQEAQETLASFKDGNQFMSNDRSQIELRRLEAEYNIAFDLFRSLSSKLMEAKIKVKENTPVFAVIDQPTIPISKSSPKRKTILVISFIMGIFLGIGVLLSKTLIAFLKEKVFFEQTAES